MPYRSVVICKDYYTQRLYRNLYLTIRDNWNNNNNILELGPTALDPLLVSPFALGRPVAVDGKCRPVRLLSGAVPLYAPTVKLPRRTVYMYLISAHTYGDSDICPSPTPAPSPENSYRGHYSLVCVRIGMSGRCPRW